MKPERGWWFGFALTLAALTPCAVLFFSVYGDPFALLPVLVLSTTASPLSVVGLAYLLARPYSLGWKTFFAALALANLVMFGLILRGLAIGAAETF